MPGSVTEVKVSVGDEVKVNQPLLIPKHENGNNNSSSV